MDSEEFLKVVLKASNHIEARHWMYWNWPQEPQQYAIGFNPNHDIYGRVGEMLSDMSFNGKELYSGECVVYYIERKNL